MNVAVLGLWHLGCVTAACTAAAGHDVIGWDPDPAVIAGLNERRPPIAEPGLTDLLSTGVSSGHLRFTAHLADAVSTADVLWLTFDTPVDEDDQADVESVLESARAALVHAKDGALLVSSSQLPVGSVARLEHETGRTTIGFACCPENLRLGKALEIFQRPDRIVAGIRRAEDRPVVAALFAPSSDRIEWMTVESAEMTKHAINAFLATSVAFINEIAAICEQVGADARDVERGLKTDLRIGPGAYLSPGGAFAGGTLARDLVLLEQTAIAHGLGTPLLTGVRASNDAHVAWALRALTSRLRPLAGRRVAVWGLTYKPGTSTLRRSLSVDLCRALHRAGAVVVACDPGVQNLSEAGDLGEAMTIAPSALDAARDADAVVVSTPWPEFRAVTADALVQVAPHPLVIDAGRFLGKSLGADRRIAYVSVGSAPA